MYNFKEPAFETISQENFLPQELIDTLLKTYQNIQKYVHKNVGRKCKLTEVFFPLETRHSQNIKICYVQHPPLIEETRIPTPEIAKRVSRRLINFLENNVDKKASVRVSRLCIHNLVTPLTIHCDGSDITNRLEARVDDMSEFTERHYPIISKNMYNQGLITLKNDNPYNGMVIFDQWFPISSYIRQTENYTENSVKPLITFYKDDSWTRYGQAIRNATNAPLSDNDWNHLQSQVQNPQLLDKDEFNGLSIDKALHLGNPGTLNAWANKKYHASLPTNDWQMSSTRLNLQFETYEV